MGEIAAVGAAIGSFFADAGAAVAAGIGLEGTTLLGVSTGALIGDTLGGIAGGALLGGAEGALTGQPILKSAGLGALGGAVTGFAGPLLGAGLGIGSTAGGGLAGAAGGALSGFAGGTNPLTGALTGGIGGAVAGSLSGPGGSTPMETASGSAAGSLSGGPGASAVSAAAPASLGPDTTNLDFTTPTETFNAQPIGGAPLASAIPLAPADSNALTGQLALANTPTSDLGLVQGATAGIPPSAGLSPTESLNAQPTTGAPTTTALPTGGGADTTGLTANDITGGSPNVAGSGPNDPNAPAGTTAPAGTHTNSIGNLIHNPTSLDAWGTALSNNANLILPAALIGYQGLTSAKGASAIPGYNQIAGTASNLTAQSAQLQGYLTSGTLPPGVQTSIDQAGAAARAAIRSQYASRGMSGSSAEAADLANVQNTLVSEGAKIATTLLQTGVSEAQLASQLYGTIMNTQIAQDNQLSTALATLAGAAARPTTVTGAPTA